MSNDSYHHEGLKEEMIQKGLQLLNKEGYEGFSLRKLAAACNVSHAAPYRHFRNKDELIREISLEISEKMEEAFAKAIAPFAGNPERQFREFCRQYVLFMVENPDYFRYVFMTDHGRPIVFAENEIIHGKNLPFALGEDLAKAYFSRFHNNATDWIEDFLAAWSQIQGFTLLLVNHTIEYKGDYLALADRMLEGLMKPDKPGSP